MSLCINPACTQPHQSGPQEYRFCQNCGSQLDLLERYRVMRLICDNSGFSKVYEAYEKDTPKIIKVLQANLGADPKIVELFQQEVAVLGQLNHPGIPKVDGYFQYKTRDGLLLHCLVMEQINGINLEQWLKQHDNVPISQTQAIAWLKQLLEILVVLHGKQYLHRDIKPCNIMIRNSPENQTQEDGGDLFLIDFGTAKELAKSLTGVNAIMSSGYSAPEQLHGEAVPQSDFLL